MSVTLRGNKWQAYVSYKGERKRQTFETKAAAEKWEAEARQLLIKGKSVPEVGSSAPVGNTIEAMTKRAFNKYWKGGKSEKQMRLNVKAIVDFFGTKTSIKDVNTLAIDDFVDHLKCKGNSNGTINRKLACLSKTLKLARDYNIINTVPRIERKKEGEGRLRWLTREEEVAILNLLNDWGLDDLRDAFIVSIDTGCRLGELTKMKGEDILNEGIYLVDRKASNHSVIPLTSRAREVLERRAMSFRGRLFPYSGNWVRSPWERVKNHLGLDDVVWHTLRHTTCSRLVQRGMPLTHVKEWMGHKAIQTTMRYSHLATSHLSLGVSLLENEE